MSQKGWFQNRLNQKKQALFSGQLKVKKNKAE
jgi:hypothetical protein